MVAQPHLQDYNHNSLPVDGTYVDEAAYFAIELAHEERFEYIDGRIYMMAGASDTHSVIVNNVHGHLFNGLRGGKCKAFTNDMRTKAGKSVNYYYPDIVVTCGEREYTSGKPPTLLNPIVIIEVLSTSTEAFDQSDKASRYREIASLQTYVLIHQRAMFVEIYERFKEGWFYKAYRQAEDVIELPAIGARLLLVDIYEDVAFAESAQDALISSETEE